MTRRSVPRLPSSLEQYERPATQRPSQRTQAQPDPYDPSGSAAMVYMPLGHPGSAQWSYDIDPNNMMPIQEVINTSPLVQPQHLSQPSHTSYTTQPHHSTQYLQPPPGGPTMHEQDTPRRSTHHQTGSTSSSSSAWTQEEDARLVKYKSANITWSAVAEKFPGKTGNACRKRHERFMKSTRPDMDQEKLAELSLAYKEMREAMWTPLGERVGEPWNTVEKVCMERGLKTMLGQASRHSRKRSRANTDAGASSNGSDSDAHVHVRTRDKRSDSAIAFNGNGTGHGHSRSDAVTLNGTATAESLGYATSQAHGLGNGHSHSHSHSQSHSHGNSNGEPSSRRSSHSHHSHHSSHHSHHSGHSQSHSGTIARNGNGALPSWDILHSPHGR